MTPAQPQEVPVRLLFDNAGGMIVFSHVAHGRDDRFGAIPCATCHHESKQPTERPMACSSCHPADYDGPWRKEHSTAIDPAFCGRCHHAAPGGLAEGWDHDAHAQDYASDCKDCHHSEDIEPAPQACSDCHQETGDESMPSMRDAAHTRCETCHADLFEEAPANCKTCHAFKEGAQVAQPFPACASCHYSDTKAQLPARMNAFHDGCMGCHKDTGRGPYKEDDCNLCHMR
jgi:hypothetical protein